ncbi:hypothetical protein TSUD_185110 [Trifolium subterraneum]|uniref:Uncharacterized protein n=1 Tax=Trifolium subterraneum TaxID=3900 RepID=A0A2Z6NGB4_TRISU|nr:hypothetical protein TSUD_185110 [Trifolium subterraneum]
MAGANHEFVGENNHPNPPNHQNQFDGQEASVTPEGSAAHAQATPLDVPPPHQPPQPEDPLVVPQVPQGAQMEVVMAALVNTINRQGQILREQADNMCGQNELIREQNRRLRAVEESRAASRISRSTRRQRSSTPENNRSRSRSRSPRPAPRRHAERPVSPPRDIPRRQNHSPPRRNNHVSPPRNRRSPPRRNNRSPPRSGEAAARGGNARHSPRRESPGSGDERHRGPLSRRIMDITLPRGLEKPPTLDKYDGTTDPDEHVQSVETALDYRNLRGSIKCKLFPLSLVRGASTWWRNLPPGSIDSWEELCRTFTAHFTTSRLHPKTVASLKAIVQGPEESLRNYIERFNKVSVEVEAADKMKLYLLEEGLREGTKFLEAVGILEVQTLDAFFELAQRYIKYEDKQKASEASSQREERRGDEKKREGGKVREAKPPKSQFTYHTPLNAPRDRILSKISNAEFKSAGIRFPKQLPAKPNVDKKKFCRFHKSYGHVTDDCVHLKDAIEILIQKGYARQYVDEQPRTANNNAPRQNQLAVDPASPEQHVEEENREKGALDYLAAHLDGSWENFPGALVISGGGFNPITIGSIKRKFDELEKASPIEEIKITEVKESSVPLAFYREEVPGGSPNFQIPLLVRAKMANFDVRRILVDQGSSCDIMYSGLFKVLQLTEENLVPYAMKSVKVKFLVVDCPSLYNCIIGRPTLAELFAVSSTIHLKLKYYTKDGQVATINGDIEAARRCFEAASKNLNSVVTPKNKKAEAKLSGVNLISIEDGVELDARTSKKERKQEKKASKDDLLIKENYRPIPDGEFELVPLGEDPAKGVKIGADLPDLVKRQLKACLRENAELFAWSAAEMPGIDSEVACHQLTIDPRTSAVVQRRRKQSPEKAEAARKAVKDLLEANFIAEAQYTTWLSNVVLVKKSNGKWRMCVDYTDLNRACPKDAYPLPNIDKLVDNSSGFKLLSFMDAYSGYNQIKMAEIDKKKTTFMTETGSYYNNVMPFGLKNTGATYQRMMNKAFHNEIGDMLEVYMDDMIVKSEEEIDHTVHLKRVFDQARKFNMRFNPEKCKFGVKAGKFLGFYLTERGIEANPYKCRAFFDYPTPKSKKSIQTLNGMLTSMARFVAKSAQHAFPLFKLLRKETTFEWTEECEGALQHLKRALSEPPVLTRPVEGEKLYLYLAVASEAISAVLIRETEQGQKPVYFVSRALQGPELRYLQIEKIALAVIMAARKLRYYYLAHSIIIRTDQPVKQLLARPVELAEFDISFESRKALKAQVLADFVAEMTTSTTSEKNKWTIFVDGSSNSQGSGAGIILENGDGVLIEVSLGLSFPTTNNQAEYEAFLAGLRLAEDMGAEEIKIFTDSQLVASQVSGEYKTKEERLLEYLNLIRTKLAKFKETEVKHVPREHNARADVLSKLASTRRKKAGNQSLIQETLTKPSIDRTIEVMHTPKRQRKSEKERAHTSCSTISCIEEARVEFILQEIHEGINGQHIGGRSLARKALRAGYYWPTMQNDAKDHVLRCDKCQRHGDMHLAPANELKTLISPWPFAWWGMDILGPFPTATRQVKYLIVAVDYFTKWIEAEPLAKIGASHILRFFKRNVLARFGIPQVLVTDNGTQFTNKKFQEFLATIGTTQHFTSVEHPQTNGTTPYSTTGETPFRLTYGTEAVIPVEIGEPSSRIEYPPEEDINDELLREELDLVEELRTGASLREATLKQKIAARHDKRVIKREFEKIAARHDKRVIKREFEVGSLVLRRNQKDSREGKLAANWEGPYRVRAKTENGAYHLEDLYGKEIPRTWNAEKLKQYYTLSADVHAQRGNTPCEPHRCLVQARQNAQLAMGCSMLRGKISSEEAFLDSSLGASQTLVQFHKLLGNGAYDPRHQEATVTIKRALAQRVTYLANRTSKNTKLKP